jgi:quercetin dioxygenase-like cupin family protein
MELLEIFSDPQGETHFRRSEFGMALRAFAPPAHPVLVSAERGATTTLFLEAPPGWDKIYHPTPRRQLVVLLAGKATITVTDGETVEINPGSVVLLNDTDCTGHLTQVQGDQPARFLLVGLDDG